MIKRYLPAIAAFLLLPVRSTWSAEVSPDVLGIAGNLAFETSAPMKEFAHAERKDLPADWQSQSGASGMNLLWEADNSKPWYIEYQKEGRNWITAGLANGNKNGVRWGLKILTWGFSRMADDGEFKHPDCYHSASFLVEAAAHSILLLEASPWCAEFAGETEAIKPKLLAAARWMVRPDIDALNWPDDNDYPRIFGERRYAHRRFLDAAALGQTGLLFHDKQLLEKSVWLMRNGIAFQQPDGVNPERGGHDTSYQALGLLYACRYYQIVADESMRAEMRITLNRGFDWMLSRIQPDGSIDATGNTRTGPAAEPSRDGKPKGLDYHTPAVCIAHWAQLLGKPELEEVARRLSGFDRRSQRK